MQLLNVNIIGQSGLRHVDVLRDRIKTVAVDDQSLPIMVNDIRLSFNGALAFPGLINSHDHLDFDSFPQTGNRIYNNYIEWGADIHRNNKAEINSILNIPEPLRTRWGIYKNLLAGVTTVVHHGSRLKMDTDLIDIFQDCQSIHSVGRGKNWKFHLNRLYRRKQPVVIHIGEGTDDEARHETDLLINWNFFKRDIIGVHGVAMNEKQAASFKALVWCPVSNDFLLGKTAAINFLKQRTTILFGTDSTLTASWNIWDHLRLAREKNLLSDPELYDSVTAAPAATWNMHDRGSLVEGQLADIVIAKPGVNPGTWDAFYNLNPEDILLIIHRGNIRLFDVELVEQLKKADIPVAKYTAFYINGVAKYVEGDLPGLMKSINQYNKLINFPVTIG